MGYGLKLLALFCSVSLLYVVGIFFFTRGFLLKRLVINEYSECSEFPHLLSDQQHSSNTEGCWLKKRHGKAVILIIDALRYDFALYNESLDEQEALPYHNKLKVIRDVLERMPEHGALFRFVADPPTTTMQRLKGLTTGEKLAVLFNLVFFFLVLLRFTCINVHLVHTCIVLGSSPLTAYQPAPLAPHEKARATMYMSFRLNLMNMCI